MIQRRPAHARGHTKLSWLDSYHTFSFDRYYHSRYMGFRHLRVLNEDRVQPGAGFPTHGHRDMEIITYVLEGALEHRDSLGNGSVIRPGEVQRMSAGTGIRHSEVNPSQTEPVHFLQIWIVPERPGLSPNYEQRAFKAEGNHSHLVLLVSRDAPQGAVTVHQDVALFVGLLAPGEPITHRLKPNRHAWIQVARGAVRLNGISLEASDGAAVSEKEQLEISSNEKAEFLLFDLA
ncbi:MAG: pirin family protein [Terriglobia bacterium]